MSKLTHFGKTLLNNATKSIEKDLKKRSKEITIDDISSILINSIDTIKNMKPTIVKPDSAKALKDNEVKELPPYYDNEIVVTDSIPQTISNSNEISTYRKNETTLKKISLDSNETIYMDILYDKMKNGPLTEQTKYFLLLKRKELNISLAKAKEIELEIEEIFNK